MLATAILAGAPTLPVVASADSLGDVTGRRRAVALPSADVELLQAVDRFRGVHATVLAQEEDNTVPWAAIEATGEAWHDTAGALVDIAPTTFKGLEAKAAAAAMALRAGVGDYTCPERFDIAAETHDRLALSLIEDVLRMLRGAA